MDQEKIMQIQMMEQEMNQLNQQMQMFEQNIADMNELKASLNELSDYDGKEMLVNIGKRIYLPVDKKNDVKLIVEVGKGNLIEKSVSETIEIVMEQVGKLSSGKMQVSERLEELQREIMEMIGEIEKKEKKD